MNQRPFELFALPSGRSVEKPRSRGLTMMVDWGVGLRRLDDILALNADFVDLGKIAVGTPRLYDEAVLREKFDLYARYRVRTFLGGMFIEHYLARYGMDAMGDFYVEAKRTGFEVVEVSDNLRPFSSNERRHLIRLAIDHGLAVFGEVGSKWETRDAATLVGQARECLDAGCELVLVEGAELVDESGTAKRDMLAELGRSLDLDKVLFELPGPWISGVTACQVHDLKKLLIREFGPDVNIANVMPDDLMETEALRDGLSVISVESATRSAAE